MNTNSATSRTGLGRAKLMYRVCILPKAANLCMEEFSEVRFVQREEARPGCIGRGMLRGGHNNIRKDAAGTAQKGGGDAVSGRRMTTPRGTGEKSEEPGPLGLTKKGKRFGIKSSPL